VSGDFDFEPVPGLPAELPAGETMIWQGRPQWRSLAVRAFHIRKLAIYFGLLAIWSVAVALTHGNDAASALWSVAWIVPTTVAAFVPLLLIARASARTSIYTITNRRIVMRIGIALPITFNIPFKAIEAVSLKTHGDQSGDIALVLTKGYRLAFLVMWPHARPWHVRRPQPMLRSLADPQAVAQMLVRAISPAAAAAVPLVTSPVRQPELRPADAGIPAMAE
jgi:hypothetical protein